MGVHSFKIDLEPHQKAYYAGQVVTGAVTVVADKNTSCSDVTVTCKGKGFVCWSTGSGKRRRTYTAKENYGRQQVDFPITNGTLTTGTHSFPFSFTLPQEAPSSFESQFGFIRYKVKAELSRSLNFNKKEELLFTFIQPEQLHTIAGAQVPLSYDSEETSTCCWCCEQGPVNIQIYAPAGGALLGEVVPVGGSATNKSGSDVHYLTIALKQKITYVVKRNKLKATRVLQDMEKGSLGAHKTVEWRDFRMFIPAVAPSLKFCNIMTMTYVLQVKCGFGVGGAVKGQTQFFVCTPPVSDIGTTVQGPLGPSSPLGFSPPLSTNPGAWDATDPKQNNYSVEYKPCYFSTVKKAKRLSKKEFVPLYPCLQTASSQS